MAGETAKSWLVRVDKIAKLNLGNHGLISVVSPFSRMNARKPSNAMVKAYVENLRNTLNEGSIKSRKAFLNSFIRRINIKDSEAEIEYTCPIGIGGNRKNEVLRKEQIGSRGRARTYNHTVNSRVLYH
jgi:hypothetical protein